MDFDNLITPFIALAIGKSVFGHLFGKKDKSGKKQKGLFDLSAIKDALQTLFDDPGLCQELRVKGRNRVESKFSTDSVTQRYVDLYESFALKN